MLALAMMMKREKESTEKVNPILAKDSTEKELEREKELKRRAMWAGFLSGYTRKDGTHLTDPWRASRKYQELSFNEKESEYSFSEKDDMRVVITKPLTNEQVKVPTTKLIFDLESHKISTHILENKAPVFLKRNRLCKLSNTATYKFGSKAKHQRQMPGFFVHWLRHDTLPAIPEVADDQSNCKYINTSLTGMLYLFCFAEEFEIDKLMDVIMARCCETLALKDNFRHPAEQVVSFYHKTSGPCGLRRFTIRSLVHYCVGQHRTAMGGPVVTPSEMKTMSKCPEMMRDFLAEMAVPLDNGALPLHPFDYPVDDYYHASFGRDW